MKRWLRGCIAPAHPCALLPVPSLARRASNAANERLLAAISATRRAYLIHTKLGDRIVLRLAVGSSLTEERHIDEVWSLISGLAEAALTEEAAAGAGAGASA